jgi:hypothetical protein
MLPSKFGSDFRLKRKIINELRKLSELSFSRGQPRLGKCLFFAGVSQTYWPLSGIRFHFVMGVLSVMTVYPPLATKRHVADIAFVKTFKNRDCDRYALKLERVITENISETITLEVS